MIKGQSEIEKKKEAILDILRERGCRITRQRQTILSVVLEGSCSSIKEIYYQSIAKNPQIGLATIYRFLDTLEEIGVVDRRRICCIDREYAVNLQEKKEEKNECCHRRRA